MKIIPSLKSLQTSLCEGRLVATLHYLGKFNELLYFNLYCFPLSELLPLSRRNGLEVIKGY